MGWFWADWQYWKKNLVPNNFWGPFKGEIFFFNFFENIVAFAQKSCMKWGWKKRLKRLKKGLLFLAKVLRFRPQWKWRTLLPCVPRELYVWVRNGIDNSSSKAHAFTTLGLLHYIEQGRLVKVVTVMKVQVGSLNAIVIPNDVWFSLFNIRYQIFVFFVFLFFVFWFESEWNHR